MDEPEALEDECTLSEAPEVTFTCIRPSPATCAPPPMVYSSSKDIIIEQLETEIQSLKLQKLTGNDECIKMVTNLMDEIRGLKKNLSVVESILRSSLPIVDADNYVD